MNFDVEKLYKLLPALYKLKDHELVHTDGEVPPLKALFTILADEVAHLEENLDQLYDDQFIETASEWALPYIGDLIGFEPLVPIPDNQFTIRSEVANTISYRRRKGTLSILEQLARDVTNWDANVVEYFRVLATTQYLKHLRPENVVTPDLRDWEQLEYVGSPFDTIPRSVDVRNISSRRGKYNIPNIGIFLWRIQALSRRDAIAFQVDDQRYTFHPMGVDTSLYNFPKPETSITSLATPENMPTPFKRRLLSAHLEEHYGPGKDIFIKIGDIREILPEEICIGDLSQWDSPTIDLQNDLVVIDPELGRMMFGSDFIAALTADAAQVSFHYGSLALMGGGEYHKEHTFSNHTSIITVSKEVGLGDFTQIQDAIDQAQSLTTNSVIEILDNDTYQESLDIQLQSGQSIELRGAAGRCPVIQLSSDFEIRGEGLSSLKLNGLYIDGANVVIAPDTSLEVLMIEHCTIKPMVSGNRILLGASIRLEIRNSIVSGIETFEDANVHIENSIVDGVDSTLKVISATENQRALLTTKNATIHGEVDVKAIELVENSIFTSLLTVQFLQKGCIRYSYCPWDSITPRKYNCYPATAGDIIQVVPTFTSIRYGHPAYFQLDKLSRKEFLSGADDASEIGVYHNLYQPQKVANLRVRLNEYMRFGMEAGIFFAS